MSRPRRFEFSRTALKELKTLKSVVLACDAVSLSGFWLHGRVAYVMNGVGSRVLNSVALILLLHVCLILNSSNSRSI